MLAVPGTGDFRFATDVSHDRLTSAAVNVDTTREIELHAATGPPC